MNERDSERRTWQRQQMSNANVPKHQQMIAESLLDTYWSLVKDSSFSEEDVTEAVRIFNELRQGHSITPETPDEIWVEAKPGALVIRDSVRVKSNAYTGNAGVMHNNRVGVITAIRSGDIHIRYTDGKEPNFEFIRHSPYVLEKRIQ